ncbi:hypothetical protein I3760_14G015500 [Carya illinoinensis]|nr:hypothetical protein I3760_14G015500 [Carya illinoinensis]
MGLQVGVGGKQYPERLTTSQVVESDTFGRDEDKKKVIDLLLSSNVGGNEKWVIAIFGMGGVGKTTLAQLVYNESRVKEHFDLKIWFCVSEEFDMRKVKKSIIEAATLSPCRKFESLEVLQVKVRENLYGKRFLLVLDDVWSERPIHREFLEQLLQYGAGGSKILVTTRNESVALAMHAIEPHHLNHLPDNDCWSLFAKHAFPDGSSNTDPKIDEIGRQIVKKCKGVPLAIKAIGDLLWSESNVERWTNILKSNLWHLPMKGTNILPALMLSYKNLPSYLKRCFAYCSIFPKDYIFEKDKLVLLWMAEGFLQQSEIETMEEVGNRYFDALVSRSFFQKSLGTYESGFVMHDLVNDLANFVTGQFGFTRLKGDNSKEIGKMTRYLSYFRGSLGNSDNNIEEDLYKAKQLRTFLLLDCEEWSKIKMPRAWGLKVLSLSGTWPLFDSISKMKHLRYLDVSNSLIRELPNSICMLYNLQTLKLSGCDFLERLPRNMWKLINLRHLQIDRTRQLKEMPIQMGRLKCLQTLSRFIVSKHDNGSSNIGELGNLINLRGNLIIQQLQNVRSAKDALDARLKDKRYLEELVLEWNPKELVLEWNTSKQVRERGVLENLLSHEKLKCLTIKYYDGRGLPDWIGHISLPSLCYLELINCLEVDLFREGRLPSNLKQIVIRRCEKLIANWKGWDLQILPSLEWLEIEGGSENVESFPGGLLLPTTLTNLKISSFGNLKSLDNEGFQHLTSLEELHLNRCPNLRYMPEKGFPTSLHVLRIESCHSVLKEELERKEGEEWLKVARIPNISLGFKMIQGNYLRLGESPMHALMQPHESF